jgi:hypothetical protein
VYSDSLGIDPKLIVASDKVAMIRQARAQAEATQQKIAAAQQASVAAKNVAQAGQASQAGGGDVTGMFSGYTGGVSRWR